MEPRSPQRPHEEARRNLLLCYGYLRTKYRAEFHDASQKEPRDNFIGNLLDRPDKEALKLLRSDPSQPQIYLSDALAIYLRNHEKGESKKLLAPVLEGYLSSGPSLRSIAEYLNGQNFKTAGGGAEGTAMAVSPVIKRLEG